MHPHYDQELLIPVIELASNYPALRDLITTDVFTPNSLTAVLDDPETQDGDRMIGLNKFKRRPLVFAILGNLVKFTDVAMM
jgi:hypothetical protein